MLTSQKALAATSHQQDMVCSDYLAMDNMEYMETVNNSNSTSV